MAINPKSAAKITYQGSFSSLMAHSIRAVINSFVKHGIELEILIIADVAENIRLQDPRNGAASILKTRFHAKTMPFKYDKVSAIIFIHQHANRHLARFCIAHELYHLLMELDAYLSSDRKAWTRHTHTEPEAENACNEFAFTLCKMHDDFNKTDGHREEFIYFPDNTFEKQFHAKPADQKEWPTGLKIDSEHPYWKNPDFGD